MKTKMAFIVRCHKEGELFTSTMIITENLLSKYIKTKYVTLYDKPVKEKYFTQLASEIMERFNGDSISEEEFNEFLHDWSTMLYNYTTISILDFGKLLDKTSNDYNTVQTKDYDTTTKQ